MNIIIVKIILPIIRYNFILNSCKLFRGPARGVVPFFKNR